MQKFIVVLNVAGETVQLGTYEAETLEDAFFMARQQINVRISVRTTADVPLRIRNYDLGSTFAVHEDTLRWDVQVNRVGC